MTGDQSDFFARLNSLLPSKWFSGSTPIKDALLQGIAAVFAQIYSLYAYAVMQTRIATLTDAWLDTAAYDYFGLGIQRGVGETDARFRARIQANLLLARTSRPAMAATLTKLTGQVPMIVEPCNPTDTGAYAAPNSGYGVAGAYGSMLLPFQCFIVAYRPSTSGIPNIAGYGNSQAGYGMASIGGEYASMSMVVGQIQDADIYTAIEAVRPAATVIWTQIQNAPAGSAALDQNFYLGFSILG